MRCKSCDKALSDREAVRKAPITKEYMDLCDGCFSHIAEDLGMDVEQEIDLEEEEFSDGPIPLS